MKRIDSSYKLIGFLSSRRSGADTVIINRSDEGLTLETSALESLYGGQFTLSTQLIKPNYNVATAEFRFGTFVLIEKLVFNEGYEKIGVAGSHAIDLFINNYWMRFL